MFKLLTSTASAVISVCFILGACGQSAPSQTTDLGTAHARLTELRARFGANQVLAAGSATRFEETEGGTRLHPVLPAEALRGVVHAASVELPRRANGAARVEDATSHLRVSFALRGASDSQAVVADGYALYAGALNGADVLHRAHAKARKTMWCSSRGQHRSA